MSAAIEALDKRIEHLDGRSEFPGIKDTVKKLKTLRTRLKGLVAKGESEKIPATVKRAFDKAHTAMEQSLAAQVAAKGKKAKSDANTARMLAAQYRHNLMTVNLAAQDA